ncbi:carbonic anhydrase [Methylomarinovum tepidoasis]|uniref:Carbonic anhydrase n=1 Tax=Methylomarinovum tepidoasis TaxID=2840183 RepID=A0AAU9D167_9GAMM|nr:carbonate dehydratase [Methylomarinovum sp. IN45]BCX88734.1 carbonic anhydrase [Methylomarinovum sp. IN45]
MKLLKHLFDNNRRWVQEVEQANPGFFERLAKGQAPEYLWIGCSDSRIPANEVVGLLPGELFVHRNVANLVVHSDINLLSVLQYAVDALKIKHVIVCGHYGCGGVLAAMQGEPLGLIDNWLRYIKDIYQHNADLLDALPEAERADRLCEFNVIQQAANVCYTSIVQDAWRRGQQLSIHGWIYNLKDGLLRDLNVCISSPEQLPHIYQLGARID